MSIRLLAYGAGALILLTAATWAIHSYNEGLREQGREEVRRQYAAALAAAKELAREKEKFWHQKTEEARKNANERDITIRNLATAAGASSSSLREYLSGLSRAAAGATADANRNSTVALAAVLDNCQTRYRELAEKADRHVNDVRTLQEAWPQ
ncbi:DUF2514 family protein [Massilia endophytica]|uniref:DUF2514 family protein n=1 Tax=Massilia endophytica TaxID=2899220 RepID=UPI001E2CD898|nr:DUF2514 family protein [Massilia endophytica]UGQ45071.1 DUF2514 family protein [Massilia endophytica]